MPPLDTLHWAKALSGIVTDALDHFDPWYSDEDVCAVLLERRPDLRALLEAERETKEYPLVRSYNAIRRKATRDRLTSYLDEIRPHLEKFATSDDPIEQWAPETFVDADPSIVAHIQNLHVPSVDDDPRLLIHKLGSFVGNKQVNGRVEYIFQKHSYTFLVNTSGSGKTRLSFEGLCHRWGLYFPMTGDGNKLGPNDINRDLYLLLEHDRGFKFRLPELQSPDFDSQLARNRKIVDEQFNFVLMARLLVFEMFAKFWQATPGGLVEEHKRKWLLFQLRPIFPDHPTFNLFKDLIGFARFLDPEEVLDMIAVLFFKLRKIFGPEFHLFYVLDESQVVSRTHTRAFQHDGEGYPILREIIQSWAAKSGSQEASFVILGTDIPKDGFLSAPFAESMRWLSDTGAFDDEAAHRDYVSSFLPPEYLASSPGQEFLRRMWAWCRGRHRLTDALIHVLLQEVFRTPHQLLNAYVRMATTYYPMDYAFNEPPRDRSEDHNDLHELSPEMFMDDIEAPLLKSTILHIVFHYLVTGRHPPAFSPDMPLVRCGFGRFTDSEMKLVALDEPLLVVSAARHFFNQWPWPETGEPTPNVFSALTLHRQHLTPESLTAFLPFYFERAFADGAVLSDVFSFPQEPVPQWANQRARLLALSESADNEFPALNPDSLAEVESWLDGAVGGTFCLTQATDPELIFHIKLDDDKIVRVILHSNASDTQTPEEITDSFKPSRLLQAEGTDAESPETDRVGAKLLDTAQDDGPSHILCAFASFPSETRLEAVTTSPGPVFANLDMGLFERLTTEMDSKEIVSHIVSAVTLGKRKREDPPPVPQEPASPTSHEDPPPTSPAKRPSVESDSEESEADASRSKKRERK